MTRVVSRSPEETHDLGVSFSRRLKRGDVVTLTGTLGTGKTHFVTGVCDGLGARIHATSPTFTIINEYRAPAATIVHIDLYRVAKHSELRELGIEEYLDGGYLCLIEWPEIILPMLPKTRYDIRLAHGAGNSERVIAIEEVGVQ